MYFYEIEYERVDLMILWFETLFTNLCPAYLIHKNSKRID